MNRERQLTLIPAMAGMQLARAVLHADGHVLMASGAALDETSIQRLHLNHIQTVWVVLPDSDTPPTDTATGGAAPELARLVRLFRHMGTDPADRFLFDLVNRYRRGESP